MVAGRALRGRPPSANAAFLGLADKLKEEISSGKFKVGDAFPSIRSVARTWNVGVNTAQRAVEVLKREGRLAANARRRLVVANSNREQHYLQDLVLEVINDSFDRFLNNSGYAEIQRGINYEIGRQSWPLLISHADYQSEALPHSLLALPLRGILLLGQFAPAVLDEYERMNMPVVLVDQPTSRQKLNSVSVDNVAAAFDLTRRLLEYGHRRIAFLRFVTLSLRSIDPDSRERQEGFEKAFKAVGVPFSRDYLINSFSKDKPTGANIQAIVKRSSGFTAVIAVDTSRARLVWEAAQRAQRVIPRDLCIACFRGSHPDSLSGMRADFEAVGREAVKLLESRSGSVQKLRIASRWEDRGTLGPPPATS